MTAATVIRLHPIVPPPHPPAEQSMFATLPARASLALTGCLAFLIGFNVVAVAVEHRQRAAEVVRLIHRHGIQPPTPEEILITQDARLMP